MLEWKVCGTAGIRKDTDDPIWSKMASGDHVGESVKSDKRKKAVDSTGRWKVLTLFTNSREQKRNLNNAFSLFSWFVKKNCHYSILLFSQCPLKHKVNLIYVFISLSSPNFTVGPIPWSTFFSTPPWSFTCRTNIHCTRSMMHVWQMELNCHLAGMKASWTVNSMWLAIHERLSTPSDHKCTLEKCLIQNDQISW